jgi:aminopeptidase YwaD
MTLGNGESLMSTSLNILASKEFAGRRPGTLGNEKATNYLTKKLREFGVPEHKFFPNFKQEFTIFTQMKKNGANSFNAEGMASANFEPISFSLSGQIIAKEIVFAGFGITIPSSDTELAYDDYQNIDVKNKIVVVLTGDPGTGNTKSLFRDAKYFSYRSVHYKLNNALIHGAKGILFVQDPLSLVDPNIAPNLFFNGEEGGGNRISIVAGNIQHTYLDLLLKKSNKETTLDLQKIIARAQRPYSFALTNQKASLKVQLKKETGRVSNVVAYLEGSDELLKKEIIVIGAHFDHLGLGGSSSLDPDPSPKIHFGADDNASGTALSLDLLHELMKKPSKRSLAVVFFNAEEQGLLGSKHFVSSWARFAPELGELKAMLNFDMVGRFDQKLSVMGYGSAYEWEQELENLKSVIASSAQANKLLPMAFQETAVGSSDHSSFIENKIPALFFTTGAHADYHRHSDSSEKIKFNEMVKLRYFAHKLAEDLLDGLPLTFDPDILDNANDNDAGRGYGAHLGCVPEFGQDPSLIGVLCTRATPGSPAEAAGLQAGDIITVIGDIDIKSIYDLAFALRYYRAGDEIILTWQRKNVGEMTVNLTLATRQ